MPARVRKDDRNWFLTNREDNEGVETWRVKLRQFSPNSEAAGQNVGPQGRDPVCRGRSDS